MTKSYPHAEKNIIGNSREWKSCTTTRHAESLYIQYWQWKLSQLPWLGLSVPYQAEVSGIYDWLELENNVIVLLFGYFMSW